MEKQRSEESRLNSDTAGQLKLSMLAAGCVSIVIVVVAAEMNKNVNCVEKYKTAQKCPASKYSVMTNVMKISDLYLVLLNDLNPTNCIYHQFAKHTNNIILMKRSKDTTQANICVTLTQYNSCSTIPVILK